MGIKNLATIGSATLIGNGLSGIFWFYLAALITPDDYGKINYFIGLASIAYGVSCIGTTNTITVYTAKDVKIHATLYFFSLAGGLVSSIILFVMLNRLDVVFLVFGLIISAMATGVQFGNRTFAQYARLLLIQKGLTLILGIGFYFLFGVEGVISALALSYISYSVIIFKGFRDSKVSFSLFKEKLGFILNNHMIILAGAFRDHVDKIVIVPILGFTYLGNYSLASQIIVILMMMPSTVFKYILPSDAKGKSTKKIKTYTIIISIILSLGGTFIIPIFIEEIFPQYTQISESISIMSVAIIPLSISLMLTSEFLGKEKSVIISIGTVITLPAMIGGVVLLGPSYGSVGIASAFVISCITQCVFLLYMNHKKNRMSGEIQNQSV